MKVDDYLDEAAEAIDIGGEEEARRCSGALAALMADGVHQRLLNEFLKDRSTIDTYKLRGISDVITSGRFLTLATTDRVQLVLVRHPYVTEHIYSSPNVFTQAKLSPGWARVVRYRLPADFRDDIFSGDVEIAPLSDEIVADDRPLHKGENEILDVAGLQHTPTMFLRLAYPPTGSFEWAFSRETLKPHGYSTIRLAESNLLGMLEFLAAAGDGTTADVVAPLANHELHMVRWKAVQTIAALDPVRGLEFVRAAASDPHPEIRGAAERTLMGTN